MACRSESLLTLCGLLVVNLMFLHLEQCCSAFVGEELVFQNLEEDPQKIFLESKYSYSATLKLKKKELGGDNPSRRFIDYSVRAPDYSYFGIMAVVQNLYLRKYTENSTEGENDICRDYIQFFKHNGDKKSSKICGSLYKGDSNFNSSELIGPRVYYSEYGALRLRLHVDDTMFEDDIKNPYSVGAEIVFTAYTVCPNTNVGIRTLKRCSGIEPISCISSALFCDGKIDCGFENEFALDEMHCFTTKYVKYVIVFLILGFLFCLCIYLVVAKISTNKKSSRAQ